MGMETKWISFIFFALSAAVHIGFFIYESIVLQRPSGQKILNLDDKSFKHVRMWAFHQGFYNLFLAIGTIIGLIFVRKQQVMLAGVLTSFCGASMFIAGVLLWFTVPAMRKMALLQALPPLLGFITLYFHVFGYF